MKSEPGEPEGGRRPALPDGRRRGDEEKDGGGAKVGAPRLEEIQGKGRRQAAALDSKILFS